MSSEHLGPGALPDAPPVDRPMWEAPRDASLIRLRLRDGGDFLAYYSSKWWGWVDFGDPHPLIRGDVAFAGWEPVSDAEVARIAQQSLIRWQPKRRHFVVIADKVAPAVSGPAIVRSRKLRRRQ